MNNYENEPTAKLITRYQRPGTIGHELKSRVVGLLSENMSLQMEVERLRGDLESADKACGMWQSAFMDLKEQPRKPLGNL